MTYAPQCGQGRHNRLAVPAENSRQLRPSGVVTVHSATTFLREPNARVRPSICVNLSASFDASPATSRPSVSVTTSTREVNAARCLSPPPPPMNFNVTPLPNWIAPGLPPSLDPGPRRGSSSR